MNDMTLVLMAAGVGSRFGGPKQIEPFGPTGETLIEYALRDAATAGFKKAVLIIRSELEAIVQDRVLPRVENYISVRTVFQPSEPAYEGRTKPWGTVQALLSARKETSGCFAVLNADDYYGPQAYVQIADFLKADNVTDAQSSHVGAMVAYSLGATLSNEGGVSRGICTATEKGLLESIREYTGIIRTPDGNIACATTPKILNESTLVSMNFWGFYPSFWDVLEGYWQTFLSKVSAKDPSIDPLKTECLLPEAVGCWLSKHHAQVHVLPTQSNWIGVTYPADADSVKAFLKTRL
jgi:choline kinase